MGNEIWIDGEWISEEVASTPLTSHALHYGTGVFEGIRAYDTGRGTEIFALDAHLDRLERGAQWLGLGIDRTAMAAACQQAIVRNRMGDSYLRPLVFWGEGALGLNIGKQRTHAMVTALRWQSHLGQAAIENGIRVTISTLQRNKAASIPPLKLTGGYVNSVIAKRLAGLRGFEEALFVDEHDWVCEATGENVFMVTGGNVVAVEHPDALPGITRQVIAEMTNATSRPVTRAELLAADEVFFTGTSAEVTPVTEVDGHRFPIGPRTRELQRAYDDLVRRRTQPRAAVA